MILNRDKVKVIMPSGFWDYIHLGRSTTNDGSDEEQAHNLKQGLFQIASNTCNILVQVNNTNNNINLGCGSFETKKNAHFGGECSTQSTLFDLEQSIVLLQPKHGAKLSPPTPTKVRFSRLSEYYKRRLSVSHNQHNFIKKEIIIYQHMRAESLLKYYRENYIKILCLLRHSHDKLIKFDRFLK